MQKYTVEKIVLAVTGAGKTVPETNTFSHPMYNINSKWIKD